MAAMGNVGDVGVAGGIILRVDVLRIEVLRVVRVLIILLCEESVGVVGGPVLVNRHGQIRAD